MASEFILESERESFIEQVREVIEMADEKGRGTKEGFPQVFLYNTHDDAFWLSRWAGRRQHTHLYVHLSADEWPPTTAPAVRSHAAR